MLRLSFSSSADGKKIEMGSGGGRDKWMVGLLVVVVLAAAGALAWSMKGKGDVRKKYTGINADNILKCVDPNCGHSIPMSLKDAAERFEGIPDETIRAMSPARAMCEKCQNPEYTAIVGGVCPKCGHAFLTPDALRNARSQLGMPTDDIPTGPTMCPGCGVDINKWWRENSRKSRNK